MKNLVMAIFPLAMGLLVSCTIKEKETTRIEKTIQTEKSSIVTSNGVKVDSDSTTTITSTTSTRSQGKETACEGCAEVEKVFAEIKAKRDTTFSTATAQLKARLTSQPSCLKFNGTTGWSCGPYSGSDADNLAALGEDYFIVDGDF